MLTDVSSRLHGVTFSFLFFLFFFCLSFFPDRYVAVCSCFILQTNISDSKFIFCLWMHTASGQSSFFCFKWHRFSPGTDGIRASQPSRPHWSTVSISQLIERMQQVISNVHIGSVSIGSVLRKMNYTFDISEERSNPSTELISSSQDWSTGSK